MGSLHSMDRRGHCTNFQSKALFLNPTGEMPSRFDHKFFRKLLEASWIRVQLISPIGNLKHLLGRNENEIVRWIARERRQQVLKIDKRLANNRGALRQIVAAEIERWF